MPQTILSYLPRPNVVGADDLTNVGALTECTRMGVQAAMQLEHDTDAHFICYSLASGNEHPRIKKVCVPHVVAAGDAVVLPFMAIDIDNPGHERWTGIDGVMELLDLLYEFAPHWWPAHDWSFFYSTRAGVRLFYTLTEPLPPNEWEQRARGLITEFKRQNFDVDPACKDWTRLFRLPDVMRDGVQQGDQDWAVLVEQSDRRLDLRAKACDSSDFAKLFPTKHANDEALDIRPVDDRPADDDARQLLYRNVNGRECATEWYKQAKKVLKGEPYYSALFESAPLADTGGRDNTLLRTAGSVIAKLYGRYNTSLAHVYGLLLEAALDFEPDADTPNWADATWTKAAMIWAKEEAKERASTAKEDAVEQQKLSVIDQMIAGMSEWCDDPALADPKSEAAVNFLYRHLIAIPASGKEFYVMRPDGYYDTLPCNNGTVVARISELHGNDSVFQLRVKTQNATRWATPAELANGHATPIREVAMRADKVAGGVITRIGQDLATLHLSAYARNSDLVASYSPKVDQWMRLLFGDSYDAAARWVAWALAFEEGPICALSVCGPSGVGKTLLVEGLKECLAVPVASDFSELTGGYQYRLASSPFVFTDEGLEAGFQQAHPADVFRRLIGRSDTQVKRKFLAPVNIQTDVRVCFTANNHQLIRALTSNRNVTPEDREALMVRLLHVDVDSKAADWLVIQGGRRFTEKWISNGRESNYTVAQHFLWLYEQREKFGKDDRLLVEGNMDEGVMNDLRLHSGQMDLVVEAVARMIDCPEGSKRRGDTRASENEVYVLVADVHHYIGTELNTKISVSSVRDLLTSLLPKHSTDAKGNVKVKAIDGDRRRWYSIDVQFLRDVCNEYGWTLAKITDPDKSPMPFPDLQESTDDEPPITFRLPQRA